MWTSFQLPKISFGVGGLYLIGHKMDSRLYWWHIHIYVWLCEGKQNNNPISRFTLLPILMHVDDRMMLIWKWNKNVQIWEILQNFAIASKFELPRLHGPTSLRIKWCKHTDLSWDLFQILHIWSFNTRPLALGDYSGVFNLQIWKHKLKELNSNMCYFRKIWHVDSMS